MVRPSRETLGPPMNSSVFVTTPHGSRAGGFWVGLER
jgi:hypothetical protein